MTASSSVHADPPPPIVPEPSGVISYATGSALGKGGFAICHRAEKLEHGAATGQVVALKIVKSKMEPAKIAQKFVTELQIHSKLSHPNIVGFHRAFSYETSTYVVLELCSNGSLADMVKRRKNLTLPEIRRVVIQICGAIKYLHHRHIVHRDLKTGNLFLDSNMNVKVGDFGLAALVVTEKEMEVRRRTTMCGTPNYLAPEILEKGKGHDEKVDLWAIGVIAYNLAVGKSPFHATTKEEIYKKLKSGAYTWPELNASTNQSSDLRDLVSSLLVPEELRPLPDQIVAHPFFKIAFVPPRIPSSARQQAPVWPDASLPSVDTLRRGYSETWWTLCKESGVGEYEDGKCFPLNGGRKVRSIVHDMAKEAQAGRQPTMPIPKDVVYTSLLSDLGCIAEEPKSSSSTTLLKEISHNEVASTRPHVSARDRALRAGEVMPPPPPPKAAARVARTGTVRRAARTISEETAARETEVINVAAEIPAHGEDIQMSRTRPVPTATTSFRHLHSLSTTNQLVQPQQSLSSDTAMDKLQRASSIKRSADASLARRPRHVKAASDSAMGFDRGQVAASTLPSQSRRAERERPRSPVNVPQEQPLLTATNQMAKLSVSRVTRKAQAAKEVIEVLSDPESDEARPVQKARPVSQIAPRSTWRAETSATRSDERLTVIPSTTVQRPIAYRSSTDPTALSGTDPATVLRRLSQFRDNLARELAHATSARSSTLTATMRRPLPAGQTISLPFVSRWVDYSRKHGVGYVLADGTVGCIINATAKHPVTHVLVRNGQRWLKKISSGKDAHGKATFAGIENVPFEIFEDHSSSTTAGGAFSTTAGICRKVYKGLGSVQSGPLAADDDRRRDLSVLWVKFGRYMCQSLLESGAEAHSGRAAATGADLPEQGFVRFYQRISGVGLWAFSDGCLQVHFPDHTKLVLSADGREISATLLSVDGCAHLQRAGDLLPQHVNGREVFTATVGDMLGGADRSRAAMVKTNCLKEKLTFVQEVVAQWTQNGGLGRLNEDDDCATGRVATKTLIWEGLAVKDSARKAADRVTVGRCGGD